MTPQPAQAKVCSAQSSRIGRTVQSAKHTHLSKLRLNHLYRRGRPIGLLDGTTRSAMVPLVCSPKWRGISPSHFATQW